MVALPRMGIEGEGGEEKAAALFDILDQDGNGELDFRELHAALRQGAAVTLQPPLKPGAVAHAKPVAKDVAKPFRPRVPAKERPAPPPKARAAKAAGMANQHLPTSEAEVTVAEGPVLQQPAAQEGNGDAAGNTEQQWRTWSSGHEMGRATKSIAEKAEPPPPNKKTPTPSKAARVSPPRRPRTPSPPKPDQWWRPKKQDSELPPPRRATRESSLPPNLLETFQRLRVDLQLNFSTVRDAFKRYDEDGNSRVSREEWMVALPRMGIEGEGGEEKAAALFDILDQDGNGELDFRELHAALRQGAAVTLQPPLKPGAVAFDVGTRSRSGGGRDGGAPDADGNVEDPPEHHARSNALSGGFGSPPRRKQPKQHRPSASPQQQQAHGASAAEGVTPSPPSRGRVPSMKSLPAPRRSVLTSPPARSPPARARSASPQRVSTQQGDANAAVDAIRATTAGGRKGRSRSASPAGSAFKAERRAAKPRSKSPPAREMTASEKAAAERERERAERIAARNEAARAENAKHVEEQKKWIKKKRREEKEAKKAAKEAANAKKAKEARRAAAAALGKKHLEAVAAEERESAAKAIKKKKKEEAKGTKSKKEQAAPKEKRRLVFNGMDLGTDSSDCSDEEDSDEE